MYEFTAVCLVRFLRNQGLLFVEAFLEECMAVVVNSLDVVRQYLEESGADVEGMSDQDLEEASEVFPLPDGSYLVVEG